jgi:uncharacterized membrane protein YkvA (DUF1232 family)
MGIAKTRSLVARVLSYFRDPSVSLWRKLLGFGAIAYVVLPFDAIPDFIPVIGWLDDVGVVSAVAFFLIKDIRRHAPPALVDAR